MTAYIDDLTWLKNNVYGRSWYKFRHFLNEQMELPGSNIIHKVRQRCKDDLRLINEFIGQAQGKKKGN